MAESNLGTHATRGGPPALFLVDMDGREIPGSRRRVDGCEGPEQVAAIERALAQAAGEDCDVRDNVGDWAAFWAERNA